MGWIKAAIIGALVGFFIYLIIVLAGVLTPACGGDPDINLNAPAICDFSFVLVMGLVVALPITLFVFAFFWDYNSLSL